MNTTIKPSYLFLAAAMLMSGCARDYDVDLPGGTDPDSRQIVFRTTLPSPESRATITTKDNLPYFHVTAFDPVDGSKVVNDTLQPNFANELIEITDRNGQLTSPWCVWPDMGKESHIVTFFGFYPGLEDLDGAELVNASTPGAFDYKLTGFRVATEIADQLDFVTAYTTGSMADNLFSGITLPFAHQLSRIEIKAYGEHKSCDIEIAGVRIGGTGVEDTFDFRPVDGGGVWTGNPARGIVKYVYGEGDTIFTCGKNHPVVFDDAVSIMGRKRFGRYDNSAMLIPADYAEWDYKGDPRNARNQMYISVLLRVTDATPTAGINPIERQRFPYKDLSQGVNSLNVPVVYMAVIKESGVVSTRLYKNDQGFFTDENFEDHYEYPDTEEIKEFGWAALPVTGSWAPGNVYTYTLDYTQGVGLLDPEVTTTLPGAGDPVISDRVGLSYSVKEWNVGGGSDFPVPGS